VLVPNHGSAQGRRHRHRLRVEGRKALRRSVTLGGTLGDSRQVLTGVSAGDAVIVDAPAELKDDAPVTVAKP